MRVSLKDIVVVELQEDRSPFAQLMTVAKCRPETDIREAICQYDFSVIPRPLVANDGTMLHCSMKGALMGILEKTGKSLDTSTASDTVGTLTTTMKVAIINEMADISLLTSCTG